MKSLIAQLKKQKSLLDASRIVFNTAVDNRNYASEMLFLMQELKYAEEVNKAAPVLRRLIRQSAELSLYKFTETELKHLNSEYYRSYIKDIALSVSLHMESVIQNINQFIDRRFTI